jgi:predicted nicotinamide N-methyase
MLRIRLTKPINTNIIMGKCYDVELILVEETGKMPNLNGFEVGVSIRLLNGETFQSIPNSSLEIITTSNSTVNQSKTKSQNHKTLFFSGKTCSLSFGFRLNTIPHFCCCLIIEWTKSTQPIQSTKLVILSLITNLFLLNNNEKTGNNNNNNSLLEQYISPPLQRISIRLLKKSKNKEKQEEQRIMILEQIGGFIEGFGHLAWDSAILSSYFLMLEWNWPQNKSIQNVVEIGSGTGLVGMICSAYFGSQVKLILTDLPETLKLTQANLNANNACFISNKSMIGCEVLKWENDPTIGEKVCLMGEIDLIVCSDCVYDNDLFIPLVNTLVRLCCKNTVVLLMARKRYGCDFDLFLSILNSKFKVENLSFNSLDMKNLLESSTISIAKKPTVPNLFKLTLL